MKVTSEIPIYEIDGTETKIGHGNVLLVKSHWNKNTLVELEFQGKRITVPSDELAKAIENAENHI